MRGTLGAALTISAYAVYVVFWARLYIAAVALCRAASQLGATWRRGHARRVSPLMVFDLIFFRRLLSSNRLLWLGSWTFHASLFFVAIRHLRYFLDPVPECVRLLQPFGTCAGYTLFMSLSFLLVLRASRGGGEYVSPYNYLLLLLLFLASATGLLMRLFFRPDLIGVKTFVLGIFALAPAAAPEGGFFIAHFLLFLALLLLLPPHVFAAPAVTIAARLRDETLAEVIHD